MNRKMQKILSILLTLCMLLGNAPFPALAAEDGNAGASTTNGYYDASGNWVAGGTGSTTCDVDGTNVTLSKTATPVEGQPNTYNITLQVVTSTTTNTYTDGGAVVLVIDTSSSMKSCAECGGRDRHNSNCPGGYTGSVTSAQSRLTAAKGAASTFLENYAGEDASAARMLAIVTFDGGYRTNLSWANVAGGNGQNSYSSAYSTIWGLNYTQGTNMEGGLKTALDLLSDPAVNSFSQKNVVLLSDGAPTSRIGSSGISASKANCDAAANQATAIKATGAKLYTVCFGAARDTAYTGGPTVSAFLSGSVATSGCAYDADNTDQLYGAFKAISESITSGLSGLGWTATDPMADMMDVSGGAGANFTTEDGNTYTWHLANAKVTQNGNVTTYTYTYTYQVTFDVQGENFEEGQFFPTNEPTYLNVNGKQYAFPVPGVKGVLPRTDVSITKVWDDDNNRDNKRTDSVTVVLKEGDRVIGEAVLNADNNWTYTWDGETYNLIEKSKGQYHVYVAEEKEIPDGYKVIADDSQDGNFKLVLTNKHEIDTSKKITVTKVWNDASNQDGIRPGSVTVKLLADGEEVATAQLTANNNWSHTFDNLTVNREGKVGDPIAYTVVETDVPTGYTASVDGYIVTNTHVPEKTEVKVTKAWDDANNQDGIRPQTVKIALLANGVETGKTLELSAPDWTGTFSDLDKFANGVEIKYSVKEVDMDSRYTASISGDAKNGFTVTNKHVPETTSISGAKTWEDNNNQDGKRPASITINLYADGEKIDSKVVKPDANGNWTWTFANLPVYKAGAVGQKIVYTINEDEVSGYTPEVFGYNVTNTHTPEVRTIQVVKIWEDDYDRDGIRPQNVTIILLANGEPYGEPLVLTGDDWAGSFNNLPVYANGSRITYTIQELEVNGYSTQISDIENGIFTVTNTHKIETTEVSVNKVWNDAENQDGKRPEAITVRLMNGDVKVDEIVLNEENKWQHTFENLPENENGKKINYTVVEVVPEGYTMKITGDDEIGYTITNSYTPAETTLTVQKFWNDDNNRDGIRPEAIVVYLKINGETSDQSVTLSENNNWTATFEHLPVYQNAKLQAYGVVELAVKDYTSVIKLNEETGIWEITNSHTPEKIEISGNKTWLDNDDQDGKRPESITVHLYANGNLLKTVEAKANDWSWTFTDLFKKDGGKDIVYTIEEEKVEGYTTVIDGYNITNSYTPEETSVQVLKVWQDGNDQDGKRPAEITVTLLADGKIVDEVVLTKDNNWSHSFTGLAKYRDGGTEIVYTVEEDGVPEGYESVTKKNDTNTGYVITNSHTPELIEIKGVKAWDDNNNQDGKRPEKITVVLKANGENVATTEATADNNWEWSFSNMPKYADGKLIEYTIAEISVDEYNLASITGDAYTEFTITNKHDPEKVSIPVTKVWVDDNNRDGIRPEAITVVLLADGEKVQEMTLDSTTNWAGIFVDLDKYADGKEIKYTVDEVEVKGYTKEITTDVTGVTITNTHIPERITVSGTKTWVDNDDQDGKRPESITVKLMAGGEILDSVTVTPDENGIWSWSFDDLYKYSEGKLIEYSFVEDVVDEYTTDYNGYEVINTHAPEKTSVTVSKKWVDNDNQDGIRANDVTVVLYANGVKTDKTLVLSSGNNWTGSFSDLDKYADGEVIAYTIQENEVAGYTADITGDQTEGYVVTNTHTPATVSVEGEKTWVDNDNQDGKRPESITVKLLANGKVIDSVEVTEEDGWKWSFVDLPKFEKGVEITYSVMENAVDEYSTEYVDGTYNVINTHTPEQISVSVVKAWLDNNDQDGIRPDEITVILLANGEATGDKLVLDADCNWTGSFTELDKYADGVEIEYTVEEISVDGYKTQITGDMTTGYVVSNSHTPETISVSGIKTWNDNDNQDGVRPESITVNLLANGKVIKTATVTEAEDWSYSFENLPKYENGGVEIVYTITEDAVEGYTTTYDGYNITNSYTPAEISITVTKAWADSDDEDGLRPGKITITLYADGELTKQTLVLTADDKWTGSFVGLPKYANGVEIVYTIGEKAVEGYNTVIRGDSTKGFVVTNSHTVIPQTGDERTPILWMLMMLASMSVVAYVYYDTKKKRSAN